MYSNFIGNLIGVISRDGDEIKFHMGLMEDVNPDAIVLNPGKYKIYENFIDDSRISFCICSRSLSPVTNHFSSFFFSLFFFLLSFFFLYFYFLLLGYKFIDDNSAVEFCRVSININMILYYAVSLRVKLSLKIIEITPSDWVTVDHGNFQAANVLSLPDRMIFSGDWFLQPQQSPSPSK